MANGVNNCFMINAPAGSGKTTCIKGMVRDIVSANAKDMVLCITYTKRAAEELSSELLSENVAVGTIHSFMNTFMRKYFSHSAVIDLYFDTYREDIEARIANLNSKDHITKSNEKYIEEYGSLDFNTVRENTKCLYYDEAPFMSLYNGGLSHDELIRFSRIFFETYPVATKGLSSKYQHVFIDEFQDTSADVLKIFFSSVEGTKTRLYLFGDRMQQIYKNYDGSFEQQLSQFDASMVLRTNYRSQPAIVQLLNNIYNDDTLVQYSSGEMESAASTQPPRLIISGDVNAAVEEIISTQPDTLILRLFNKERFAAIGALELFKAVTDIERYSFGRKYSAVDVLTTRSADNPDPMFKLLFLITDMNREFNAKRYGLVIKALRANDATFDRDSWRIEKHTDKLVLFEKLSSVFSTLNDPRKTIGDLLKTVSGSLLLKKSFADNLASDQSYDDVQAINTTQLLGIYNYLSSQTVSTQHGVKGESHEGVLFVAENSTKIPVVNMYELFEMWSKIDISLIDFQNFYYGYHMRIDELQIIMDMTVSKLDSTSYIVHKLAIDQTISNIRSAYSENAYFQFLYAREFSDYESKQTVTNAKKCLKESIVYGVLSAYKLFYVGCSRARKNLTVLLDNQELHGNREAQKQKFIQLGFEVIEE